MHTFSRFAAIATLALASAGSASAALLTLGSYGQLTNSGTPNSTPAGFSNTALLYTGGSTYNVPTGGIWNGPLDGSSWVTINPNAYPGGGVHPANGSYTFTTTFLDMTPGSSSGTITVLADDTTSIMLNGTVITTAAFAGPAGHCDLNTPNCLTPTTYSLSGFLSGLNTLSFTVYQQFDEAMGLDFTASVNTSAVPEPGSLMLLGTGLIGVSGQIFRRLRA